MLALAGPLQELESGSAEPLNFSFLKFLGWKTTDLVFDLSFTKAELIFFNLLDYNHFVTFYETRNSLQFKDRDVLLNALPCATECSL